MPRLLFFFLLLLFNVTLKSQTELRLPSTSEQAALECPWFPSQMHAFVWRNWTLVPCERIAQLLQTSTTQIEQVALSMGLEKQGNIDTTWLSSKGYITVLRRNWHLLPYEQILQLLRMSEGQLAWRLIDDDYLYVKMGSVKPLCKKLIYHTPTTEENRKAALISRWVRELQPYEHSETPRFRFFEEEDPTVILHKSQNNEKKPQLSIAFSYCSEFGDPLLDARLSSWPEVLLKRLSAQGINGLWLHTSLSSLLPPDSLFPGAEQYGKRLANLQRLVDRAGHYGIRIFLYANEPRATQRTFFQSSAARQSLGGVCEKDLQAFCTSDPRTLRWLREGYRYVFTQVRHLGGVFTITASENLTSCASHGKQAQCPRCSLRTAADIICQVNNTITEGVKQGDPEAEVIVWDWAWTTPMAEATIPRLDRRCRFMSVSEWELPLERGGIKNTVGEYSISAVGPGPRAKRHWEIARRAGLPVMAKIQVNTSWELGSVTAIPAMQLVAQHARRLARQQMSGIMYCWSLGGYPTLNMKIFNQTLADTTCTLQQIAAQYYGQQAAPMVEQAWQHFSNGMSHFPYHISTLYYGPQHSAPANPLYLDNTHWHATMVGIPYDDLTKWRGPYPEETYIQLMRQTVAGFRNGLPLLCKASGKARPDKQALLQADARHTQAIALIYESVANQAEFIHHRNALRGEKEKKAGHLKQMRNCIRREKAMVSQLLPLLQADPTLGYESSNQYFYIPQDLREKYLNLCYTEQQLKLR